jgi:hypothetical protein
LDGTTEKKIKAIKMWKYKRMEKSAVRKEKPNKVMKKNNNSTIEKGTILT